MRRELTEPEKRLWLSLRGRRLNGLKLSRQVVIGPYIADFAAKSSKLINEVDGDTHARDERRDAARTAWLEAQGYRVIRFSNQDVTTNLDGMLQTLATALAATPLPTSAGSAMPPASPKRHGVLFTRQSPKGRELT